MGKAPSHLLICSCEKTMPLDATAIGRGCPGKITQANQLCGLELDRFKEVLADGAPVTVACTQEAPLFREVAEACRKAGMKVVDWNCEKLDHRKGWEIISSLYWPDGGEQVLNSLKETGEPVLPLSKWIIQEQPSVKNLTQQELWDVSVYHLICRSTTSQQLTNNPSAPPKEKPTAPPTHKPGPPPPTQTETGKKLT